MDNFRPTHVPIEEYVVLRDALAEAMNLLDIDHTPTTLRLTEMLDKATELCDLPGSTETDIERFRNRVACRLDKIISEQAREAVRYLLGDLPKMHEAW